MLGSKSKFFNKSTAELKALRYSVQKLLEIKGYTGFEVLIYLKAFDYFCQNPSQFDGATIVKDLVDIPGLDLDAMLHDYHYIHHNAAANFVTKWKADWLFAKGNERKSKGQYSAFSRFIGLTIIGIGFVPYAFYKRGKIKENQKKAFLEEYKTLIN